MISMLYDYGVWSGLQTPKYIANRPMQYCGGASDRYGPAKKYFGNDKLLSTCFKMKIQSSKVKYFGGVNM